MNIVIVSWDYPDYRRSVFPFVKNLVVEWTKQGHSCTVVAPYSITQNKRFCKYASKEENNKITVLRPNYISLSTLTIFGISLTNYLHEKAVNRALKSIKSIPDIIYCHFWRSAVEACDYANSRNIPMFVATGESIIRDFDEEIKKRLNRCVRGVIAVSTKNKDESIMLGLTDPGRIKVFPNAVDPTLFRKLDKIECRKKLGFPINGFIIAYVGGFHSRKGIERVEAALNLVNDETVYSIFVGGGAHIPVCNNILFKGKLSHNMVPEYLNAADAFVLPTLHEGCCNAIVEAMACGLPIISSNMSFNKDICNEDNSILCNPMNIEELYNAIIKLRDHKQLREELSHGALLSAQSLSIDKRATRIINYMKDKI